MLRINKISIPQIFSTLLLSRMIALFTFMLPTSSFLASGDKIITPLFFALFELFYSFTVCFFIKKTDNLGIPEKASSISPFFGKTTALFYAFVFIWFAGINISRFELFISTVMFPNSELYLMTVILLAAAFYSALKGIEAIGRASVILAALLGVVIVFIASTVIGGFEYTNLKPVFTQGLSPILKFSFYISARASEFITLYINAPKINGNLRKLCIPWILTVTLISFSVLFILSGVTGEYGDNQLFPLYTLTVIAKFGIFERLDDVLTGMWVLCSFIQLSYLLLTCFSALEQGFGKVKKIPVYLAASAGIFTVYLFASTTVTVFSEIISSRFNDIIFIIALLIIPFLTVLLNRRKQKKALPSVRKNIVLQQKKENT